MADPSLEMGGCSMHEPYALQVLGKEMEPEFPDKCIVLIEPNEFCNDGMFVFVEVEGVRWFRQYRRDDQGRERLVALNGLFPDIDLTGLEWKVLGIIIQRNVRRKVKHYEYDVKRPAAQVPLASLTGQV